MERIWSDKLPALQDALGNSLSEEVLSAKTFFFLAMHVPSFIDSQTCVRDQDRRRVTARHLQSCVHVLKWAETLKYSFGRGLEVR